MTHKPRPRQPDLFVADEPTVMLTRAEAGRLVPLVSALLMEAVVDHLATEGDREDHA